MKTTKYGSVIMQLSLHSHAREQPLIYHMPDKTEASYSCLSVIQALHFNYIFLNPLKLLYLKECAPAY